MNEDRTAPDQPDGGRSGRQRQTDSRGAEGSEQGWGGTRGHARARACRVSASRFAVERWVRGGKLAGTRRARKGVGGSATGAGRRAGAERLGRRTASVQQRGTAA